MQILVGVAHCFGRLLRGGVRGQRLVAGIGFVKGCAVSLAVDRRGRDVDEAPQGAVALGRFDEAVAEAGGSSVALIAWEAAGAPPLREAMAGPDDPSGVALFIGPEGGYEAAEVELAEQASVRPFTLGRRILRTETAAVVAAALVLYELSEME